MKNEFEKFLEEVLTIPEEDTRPFCPFDGGYCNSAYSETCRICQDARKAYDELKTKK